MVALRRALQDVVQGAHTRIDSIRNSDAELPGKLRQFAALVARIQGFVESVERDAERLCEHGRFGLSRVLTDSLEPVRELVRATRAAALASIHTAPFGSGIGFEVAASPIAYPARWDAWRAASDAMIAPRGGARLLRAPRRPFGRRRFGGGSVARVHDWRRLHGL